MTEKTDNLNESLSALLDGECSDSELNSLLDAIGEDSSEEILASANESSFKPDSSSGPSSEFEVGSSSELRQKLSRYYLAQSALKGNIHSDPRVDLSASISAAIAKEDAPQITPIEGRWATWKNWRDFAGKSAIAASVAIAFVAGVQYVNTPLNGSIDGAVVADKTDVNSPHIQGAGVPQGFELPPLSARTVSAGQNTQSSIGSSNQVNVAPANATLPTGTIVIRDQEVNAMVNRLLYKHAEQTATSGGLGVIPYARVSDVEAAEE